MKCVKIQPCSIRLGGQRYPQFIQFLDAEFEHQQPSKIFGILFPDFKISVLLRPKFNLIAPVNEESFLNTTNPLLNPMYHPEAELTFEVEEYPETEKDRIDFIFWKNFCEFSKDYDILEDKMKDFGAYLPNLGGCHTERMSNVTSQLNVFSEAFETILSHSNSTCRKTKDVQKKAESLEEDLKVQIAKNKNSKNNIWKSI